MAKYSGTVATKVSPSPPQQQQHQQHQNQQKALSSSPYHSSHDPTMARVPILMGHCPNCRQESWTRITTYSTWQTWMALGLMLLVSWPICWVPLILDNCKQTDHYCGLCQAKVGKVNVFQDCWCHGTLLTKQTNRQTKRE